MTSVHSDEPDLDALADFDVDSTSLSRVLSDDRCRFVLACLQEHDAPLTLRDIANELAVWEHDVDITDVSTEEFTSTYSDLCDDQIPKMEDAELVAVDHERSLVSLAEAGDELTSVVDLPAPRPSDSDGRSR